MMRRLQRADIVGIGQNAVDTLILVERFPGHGGKERILEERVSPGGQVATAMVACAQMGLKARYVGTVGNERGVDGLAAVQRASLRAQGVEAYLIERECATQSAYIVIDRATGERTVFWRRDAGLTLRPEDILREHLAGARLVHLDGGDMAAVVYAARMAKELGMPVSLDADTYYENLGELFPMVDYLIAAKGLLERWTHETSPEAALQRAAEEYRPKAVGITLGADGALLWADGRVYHSPAYEVACVDTTGSGDVFHGALCYAVLKNMPWPEALDFANAAAAINCLALGARGRIASLTEVREFMRTGIRRRALA